ncbi:hypothetical protein NDU88_004242 [Pleurodeles waltl]|uniref:Uncharacterized protein n=1 Tax=Pleurodeles waltl TaxID=8319 RepID=A0AAV7T880_PLEWA|nr:hypothetical protein NDU88_004242 [Pleurodeles waltl]
MCTKREYRRCIARTKQCIVHTLYAYIEAAPAALSARHKYLERVAHALSIKLKEINKSYITCLHDYLEPTCLMQAYRTRTVN